MNIAVTFVCTLYCNEIDVILVEYLRQHASSGLLLAYLSASNFGSCLDQDLQHDVWRWAIFGSCTTSVYSTLSKVTRGVTDSAHKIYIAL